MAMGRRSAHSNKRRPGNRRYVAPPPFAGEALRPLGADHPVLQPPPAEALGRMIGQQRQGLDRLRRIEQAQRPELTVPPGLWPFETLEYRASRYRPFRQVTLTRDQPIDAPRAEAICQAVEQVGQAGPLAAGAPGTSGEIVPGEAGLAGGERFDNGRRERHRLDAETGVEAFQPVPEQIGQVVGVAARTAGADAQVLPAAIHLHSREHQAPRTQPLGLQALAEDGTQVFKSSREIFRRGDGLGEEAAHLGRRRRRAGRQRFGLGTEGLAQAARQQRAEAGDQHRRRQLEQVADAPQSEAGQQLAGLRRQAQRRRRQGRQRGA